MSQFTYAGITLELIDTQGVTRQAIMSDDGTTYHWTDWYFDVIGTLSPQATSYSSSAAQLLGMGPAVTDAAIRHLMMQPRQTLTFIDGNDVILSTPATGYTTDAANGPTPISFDILEVQGLNSMLVRFRIKASVNECTGTSRPIILSHRWEMGVDIDPDHYTTRTVNGIATFRSDELLRQGFNVDQFRRDLFHPLGAYMKRDNIKVSVASDGNSVLYSFTDTEQAFQLGTNSIAVRAECLQTATAVQPGPTNVRVTATRAAGWVAGQGLGAIATALIPPAALFGGMFAQLRTAFANGSNRANPTAGSIIPEYYQSIEVRVWGNRTTQRFLLRSLAIGIAMTKVGGPSAFVASEAKLTEDCLGKFVEFTLTHRYYSLVEAGGVLAGQIVGRERLGSAYLPAGLKDMVSYMSGFNEDVNSGTAKAASNQTDIGNPTPANSRGTWSAGLGAVVAQALQSPCSLPARTRNATTTDLAIR